MAKVIKRGDPASGSFTSWVEDAVGDKYCMTIAINRPEILASTIKHAQWWSRLAHKPTPRYRTPCFPLKGIVVEFCDEMPSK